MNSFVKSILSAGSLFCAPFAMGASVTTEAGSYTPASTQNSSVLNLYCQASSKQFYQSKLVLLQSRSSSFDFALTTAHGIQKGEFSAYQSCFVRDEQGQRRNVLDVYIAENYEPGAETDWAILKLDKIKSVKLSRFALSNLGEDAPVGTEAIQVTFPRARGLNFNTQNCQAYPSEILAFRNAQILAHNCRVLKGQSGSPVVVSQEDEASLIGLHLGKAFVYRSPITKKPEHMGYFRVIDQDMIEEINMAVRSLTR